MRRGETPGSSLRVAAIAAALAGAFVLAGVAAAASSAPAARSAAAAAPAASGDLARFDRQLARGPLLVFAFHPL